MQCASTNGVPEKCSHTCAREGEALPGRTLARGCALRDLLAHLCASRREPSIVRDGRARRSGAAVGGSGGGRKEPRRPTPHTKPPDRVRRSRALGGIATCAHSDGVSNRGARVARRNARLPAHLCASTKPEQGAVLCTSTLVGAVHTRCFDYHPASLAGRAASTRALVATQAARAAAGWSVGPQCASTSKQPDSVAE